MAPGTEHNRIVATDIHLDHEVHFAEHALLEHRAGETIRAVPAVVLGGRQHRVRTRGSLEDRPASPDGDSERLLADHVHARRERRNRHDMVDRWVRHHIERLD